MKCSILDEYFAKKQFFFLYKGHLLKKLQVYPKKIKGQKNDAVVYYLLLR